MIRLVERAGTLIEANHGSSAARSPISELCPDMVVSMSVYVAAEPYWALRNVERTFKRSAGFYS